jgi:hypothetical protein
MELENISRPNLNNDNLPYVEHYVYAIEQKDIEGVNWPANPANYRAANKVAFADLTINGTLVKKAITEYKGKLNGELQGELDGQFKKHVLTLNLAGTKDENLGFDKVTNNAKMVLFIPEKSGRIRILGSNLFPATKESSNDSTGDDGETNGIVQTWMSHGPGPALILDGTVAQLEAALSYSGSASASY